MSEYESDELLGQYLLFHYGSQEEVIPWSGVDGEGGAPTGSFDFAVRSVMELLDKVEFCDGARALDVGCAVGRSTFELSKIFQEVIGIDFSQKFVSAADHMKKKGSLGYERLVEAGRYENLVARKPKGVGEDISFLQGDAQNLDPTMGEFDLVHAANLVCRLRDPSRFFVRVKDLVKTDGQLLLTTPSTWMEEYTPRENWPEGDILNYLKEQLEPEFVLEKAVDIPFLIRETNRKYQWTVALGTRWRRKG